MHINLSHNYLKSCDFAISMKKTYKAEKRRDLVSQKPARLVSVSARFRASSYFGEASSGEKMALTTSQLLKVRGRVWTLEMDEIHV